MFEAIYVVVAIITFLAQVRNGFFVALLTAAFWPVVIVGLTVYMLFSTLLILIRK